MALVDQKEIIEHIETDKRLIRPCNYPDGTPGRGYATFHLKNDVFTFHQKRAPNRAQNTKFCPVGRFPHTNLENSLVG